jgi:glutathione S-transferase
MIDNRRMKPIPYELYYWPQIQGRGEFVRLVLEEAAAPYLDVARLPEDQGGVKAMLKLMRAGGDGLQPFAPPFLKSGELLIAQTANILAYLAPRHGLVPEDESSRVSALQLQLTIGDLVSEVHDTHHPIDVGQTYEQQRPEALKRATAFVKERLPKFLGYFERVLARREHLTGDTLSYVDLSAFQVVCGLEYAFPAAMKRLSPNLPSLLGLRDRIAARPRIKEYLQSARRIPFSEQGIFRHYPELDAAAE